MTEFTSCEDCVHNNSGNDCYCNKCIYSELQDNFKPKQKKVNLKGGKYRFQMDGQVFLGEGRYYNYGDTRQTEEQAELASKRMLRVNRLSALAAQLGGEKEFVEGEKNWNICFDERWYIFDSRHKYDIEKVYMTRECAEQICDLLNKGLFDLNGDE